MKKWKVAYRVNGTSKLIEVSAVNNTLAVFAASWKLNSQGENGFEITGAEEA